MGDERFDQRFKGFDQQGAKGASSGDGTPRDGLAFDARAAARPSPQGGYGAVEPPAGDGDGFDPSRYLAVLHKRRWLAATAFIVVTVGMSVRSFTAVPVYEARARLLMDGERFNVVSFQDVFEQRADDQTQYGIFRSRSLARRTLDSLGLLRVDRPAVAAHPEMPALSWLSPESVWAHARALLAGTAGAERAAQAEAANPELTLEAEATDPEPAVEAGQIDAFLAGLFVSPVPDSRLVDVGYRSPDPVRAAEFANALVREYVNQSFEVRFEGRKEAIDWLDARLAEQRQKVDAAEQAVIEFRERHDVVPLDANDDVIVQQLGNLSTLATNATAARIEKEALVQRFRALRGEPAAQMTLASTVAVETIQPLSNELTGLRQQQARLSETLGELHPDMVAIRAAIQSVQAKLDAEVDSLGQSLQAELQAARGAEQRLLQTFEAQKQEALALNRRGLEMAILQREADASRQIYEALMQRSREADITEELRTRSVRVIDEAEVPRRPISPNVERDVRRAAAYGLGFALLLVFLVERLDNRIKSPEEIRALGLPFLGLLPVLTNDGNGSSGGARRRSARSVRSRTLFDEAIRVLRTNVMFSSADEGARSVLVTSPAPSEGKTVVSTSLARALGRAGQRVLLIDADMRRPRVHEVFGLQQEPGLSNLLAGQVKASEAVSRSPDEPDLWVLPAGRVPPHPAELLGSKRFREFLAKLDGSFDWIVIDSPPAMAVTDASVLAHAVSGVLIVIQAEGTSRGAVRETLERMNGAGARVLGAVLNRTDVERKPYYYAPHYTRKYGEYYTPMPAATASAPSSLSVRS